VPASRTSARSTSPTTLDATSHKAGSSLRERRGTGVPASAEACVWLRGVRSRLPRERREAQAELERPQKTIERVLRRIVARIDCAAHLRAGPPHPCPKLLDAHRADHLSERKLQIDPFVDRRQQELAGEGRIA